MYHYWSFFLSTKSYFLSDRDLTKDITHKEFEAQEETQSQQNEELSSVFY